MIIGISVMPFESALIILENNQDLGEGMVFTTEPGIYIPGARVEELCTSIGISIIS